jgi:pheromone shutdown protein TraB
MNQIDAAYWVGVSALIDRAIDNTLQELRKDLPRDHEIRLEVQVFNEDGHMAGGCVRSSKDIENVS